jgi:protein phosphatase
LPQNKWKECGIKKVNKFDIIGDPHGCFRELSDLMDKLGYQWNRSKGIHIPVEERKIVFVGDIVDRGPEPIVCLAYVKLMVESGNALCVMGNHDNKFMRYARGNKVQISHGLDKTVAQAREMGTDLKMLGKFVEKLPYYLKLDDDKLIVVHGAWSDELATERSDSGKMKSWCLYAPTTGKTLPSGMPDRIDWVSQRQVTDTSPWIVYGHQPYKEARIQNRTAGIDTSCVFGGKLTALRWPEMELVEVLAKEQYDKHPSVDSVKDNGSI